MSQGNRFGLLHLAPGRRALATHDLLWLFRYCDLSARNPATGRIHVTANEPLRLHEEAELDEILAGLASLSVQLWWPRSDRSTDPDDLMVVLERDERRYAISYSYVAPSGGNGDGPLFEAWRRSFRRFAREGTAVALLCDATGRAADVDWESWLADPRPLLPPYPDLMILPVATAEAFELDPRVCRQAPHGPRFRRVLA